MWNKILTVYIVAIAKKVTRVVWDSFWDVVDTLMVKAEENWDWEETGQGEDKKKFVMDFCMDYIKKHMELNWLQTFALKLFLSNIIDKVIEAVNKDYEDGGWVKYTKSLKKYLEQFVPLL